MAIAQEQNLFDTTIGYDEEVNVKLADGLNGEEIEQAIKLYHLFNELWGVCAVLGNPGTGKDLFSNIISYKIKTYFPWKKVLRDERPYELYGEYAGLFNDKILVEDLARMKAVATQTQAVSRKNDKEAVLDTALESAADLWVTTRGEVLLKNSVLYLTEYWRYCYNRDPHNPMNKTMGAVHKMKRHLDCLILGTVQLISDLDRKTCLPFIDWRVTCGRSEINPTGFIYFVEKVAYDKGRGELLSIAKPFPIAFDGGKPRSNLGDGKIRFTQKGMNYQSTNKAEKKVLEAIKAGINIYEHLVDIVRLEESEILMTLKELKFNKHKRAIDYPCFFSLYNSKSPPQIKSSLKVDKLEE